MVFGLLLCVNSSNGGRLRPPCIFLLLFPSFKSSPQTMGRHPPIRSNPQIRRATHLAIRSYVGTKSYQFLSGYFFPHHTLLRQTTTIQHQDEPPRSNPPAALPSISMATAATTPDLGSAAPYGLTQGASDWVWRRDSWFACFGGEIRPHQKIEMNMVYRP